MEMNYLKKPVLLGDIKAVVQVINGGCHVPWAAGYRPALGGWGHEMGTEMLALLQHTPMYSCPWRRVLVLLDATGHNNLVIGSAPSRGSRLDQHLQLFDGTLERRLELVYNLNATCFSHLYFPI